MKIELNGIAETLLIPVRVRAYETSRQDSLLQDPWAIRIIAQLDLEKSSKDKVSSGTLIGTVLRTLLFDQKIKTFMQKYPEGVVVNLGCGLDARYNRLCLPSILWFDLDINEVMDLRKQFFEETQNYRMLTGSMFDETWIKHIPKNRPIMIFFEGVSMYFPEEILKPFVLNVFNQFSHANMVFDVLAKANSKSTKLHPDVKKYNAPFKWGIDSATELHQWDQNIKVISDEPYMGKEHLHRWPLIFRLFWWLPAIRRMCRVIHIQYKI